MIAELIGKRRIERVVHFTTAQGFTGILDCRAVKSRQRLPAESRLEFILQNNTASRRDNDWLDYVNLSLTHVNRRFLSASQNWHKEHGWVVLGFDPVIVTHLGVYFVTTNNFYPAARRAVDAAGFEALFAPSVAGRYGTPVERVMTLSDSHTTCEQAEVLYPQQLSLDYLRTVYVREEDEIDSVRGQLAAMNFPEIAVVCSEDVYLAPLRGK